MHLPPNTCLTLVVDQGGQKSQFTAFVVGNSRWGIATTLPQILQQAYNLPAGTRLTVQFVAGNLPVQFESYVLGYQETAPPTMVMAEPHEVQRRERRGALRLPTELPVTYVTRGATVTGEKTVTVDLSLGGLALVSTLAISVGTQVAVFLSMPSGSLSLEGRVAWNGLRGKIRMTGVEFLNMTESAQRILAVYLFALERQLGGRFEPASPDGSQAGR